MPPHPIPQPRIDSFVRDPNTGEQRRQTEYTGTVWYGQIPDTTGMMVSFAQTALREDSAFFLPDSLPYKPSDLADGVVTCTVAIQGGVAEPNFVTHAEASWGDDPRGGDTAWVQLRLAVYGREPLAVSYRVVAACRSTAAPSKQVIDLRGARRRG